MTAHPQRRRATVGQRHDGLGAQVVRRDQRTHGDRLVDAHEGLAGEVGFEVSVFGLLGFHTNLRHLFNGLQRKAAGGRLGAQHHGVGAVEHGVGHVAHLGARGHRVVDHAFHHLRGGDDQLVSSARHFDHAFLQRRHHRVAHFNGQVTARHHDAVAHAQNFIELGNGLGTLELGDQPGRVFVRCGGHVAQLARHFHVGGVLGETHRHIVGLKAHGRLDVFHVLGRQRRCGQAAALLVDALVVGQHSALLDGGVHLLTAHGVHR